VLSPFELLIDSERLAVLCRALMVLACGVIALAIYDTVLGLAAPAPPKRTSKRWPVWLGLTVIVAVLVAAWSYTHR
jgi:hypothetical protein